MTRRKEKKKKKKEGGRKTRITETEIHISIMCVLRPYILCKILLWDLN